MTFIASILATVYRLATILFLRVIPSPLLQSAIPALLSLYLLLSSSKPARANVNPVVAVLFSLRTPSRIIRWVNSVINLGLLLAFLDFSVSPYFDNASDVTFSRIGAVSDSSAKILVRYPNLNETIHIVWRESKPDAVWNQGPVLDLQDTNDWADTVTLSGLWPSTDYQYALAGANSSLLPYPALPLSFRTFPDPHLPGGTHFRFVTTSCILPNFPYSPLQSRRIKGFDLLAESLFPNAEHLNSTEVPQRLPASFLLFLGDFIYADVPVYFGETLESYRRLYRRNYQSPSFRKIYERLPTFHAYDDHEFINNFSGAGNDSTPPYPSASDAFRIYNANGNPAPPPSTKALDHIPHYYDFRYGDVSFFVMDTRRYRSSPSDPPVAKTMLGEDQLSGLLDWLGKANTTATFKFIVSSVPFTSLWGHDAQYDSWAGFVNEKNILLDAMHSVSNVFVLSGDRHEFASIEFTAPAGSQHKVIEFSTSPLSMFYIPLFRTLSAQSTEIITRTHRKQTIEKTLAPEDAKFKGADESSLEIIPSSESEVNVEVITEEVPKERVLKYIPYGNYKWSSIEIDTRNPQRPTLKLEVMIDGKPSHHQEVVATPVKLQGSNALGAFVTSNMKDILKKIGMQPSKWF